MPSGRRRSERVDAAGQARDAPESAGAAPRCAAATSLDSSAAPQPPERCTAAAAAGCACRGRTACRRANYSLLLIRRLQKAQAGREPAPKFAIWREGRTRHQEHLLTLPPLRSPWAPNLIRRALVPRNSDVRVLNTR